MGDGSGGVTVQLAGDTEKLAGVTKRLADVTEIEKVLLNDVYNRLSGSQ